MKHLLFLALALWVVSGASAQKNAPGKSVPDEEITVNREYDENGNLIRLDSMRVFRWSSDSTLRFPFEEGWENLFGKDFFKDERGHSLFNDSLLNFSFPFDNFPFSLFGEEDLLEPFQDFKNDSTPTGNFLFHNDSSVFMGPRSSFVLPPGFFFPDINEFEEIRELFDRHFRLSPPGSYFGTPQQPGRTEKFSNPQQQKEWELLMKKQKAEQEEWEKLLDKQQQEIEEFLRKWEKRGPQNGFEKM